MHYLKITLKQRRWILVPQLLLAAMIALTIVVGHSQTSKAASLAALANTQACQDPGTLVESDAIKAGGSQIGELDIYYNGATGYNCAYTRTSGPAWGAANGMGVDIQTCQEIHPNKNSCGIFALNKKYVDTDFGTTYHSYAGPAGVYGKGRCIYAEGTMTWHGHTYRVTTSGASDCG